MGVRKKRPGTAREPAAVRGNRGFKVVQQCTIAREPKALYDYWRQFDRLPLFMHHLIAVEPTSDRLSRWMVRGPAGKRLVWESEIINEHPGELIAWKSRPGADVPNAGSVRFNPAPTGEGTEVTVTLEYDPPAGRLGKWVAQLFGKNPEKQVREDLRRFKAMMEAGEYPVAQSRPGARRIEPQ